MNKKQKTNHLIEVVEELKKIFSIGSCFLSDGGKYFFTIRKSYYKDKHLDKTKWEIEQHEVMYAVQQINGNTLHRTLYIKQNGNILLPKQVADDLRLKMLKDSALSKEIKQKDTAIEQYSFL